MKEKEEKKPIFLSEQLYREIEERVGATDFNSVDEYVEFVMEEVVKGEEEEEEVTFSKEEDEEVKKRLKDLGYLD